MLKQYLAIANGNYAAQIKMSDILWVERNLRKIRVVTADRVYEFYENMKNVKPQLDQRFYPCLQGCYINLEQVKAMQAQEIIFDEQNIYYLGRSNFIKAKGAFKKYLKKNPKLHKNTCNQEDNSV